MRDRMLRNHPILRFGEQTAMCNASTPPMFPTDLDRSFLSVPATAHDVPIERLSVQTPSFYLCR